MIVTAIHGQAFGHLGLERCQDLGQAAKGLTGHPTGLVAGYPAGFPVSPATSLPAGSVAGLLVASWSRGEINDYAWPLAGQAATGED